MKSALILHGTGNTHTDNWFPWLKSELELAGFEVFVPDLPDADEPDPEKYLEFLLKPDQPWKFNEDLVLIGHSSGAVAILWLLQALPEKVQVGGSYLVGSFMDDLGWPALGKLFTQPFDFIKISQSSRTWYFIHSDNDPYCPLEHAEYYHQQIGGDLVVLPGQQHFSVSTYGEEYRQFPFLRNHVAEDAADIQYLREVVLEFQKRDITFWLDGGWAVDALLGEQTRPHGDIDLVIIKEDLPKLHDFFEEYDYFSTQRGDATAWNYVLTNDQAQMIDVHVIELDKNGNGIYGPAENGDVYQAAGLTGMGEIGELQVPTLTAEQLVKDHTGYQLRAKDRHDVALLVEKFNLELPNEYLG